MTLKEFGVLASRTYVWKQSSKTSFVLPSRLTATRNIEKRAIEAFEAHAQE